MPRAQNPYSGTYAPSRMSLSKEQFISGLKSIKVRAPNKKQSTTPYKSALPKEQESGSN
jgi:hypothetical protein